VEAYCCNFLVSDYQHNSLEYVPSFWGTVQLPSENLRWSLRGDISTYGMI